MLTDVWPLFGLTVQTERLQLRLPREAEIAQLAVVAAGGVHRPDERPFLTPWAEGSAEDRSRSVLQGYWDGLGSWERDDWRLGLGIFREDVPIGNISLRARDFPVVREVTTSSWLALDHQGQGLGTEARWGALVLAFEHLGAEAALTEVFQDNHASQGVSRKLGYLHDGISRDRRDEEAVVSDRLRLPRTIWESRPHPPVAVTGFGACRPWFTD